MNGFPRWQCQPHVTAHAQIRAGMMVVLLMAMLLMAVCINRRALQILVWMTSVRSHDTHVATHARAKVNATAGLLSMTGPPRLGSRAHSASGWMRSGGHDRIDFF